MITAVRAARNESSESGQSILEFMLMLPLMLGLSTLVVRVSSAVQAGIVNQQYARAQMLFIAHNSPMYPRLDLRNKIASDNKDNQMIVGVSDNPSDDNMQPEAPRVKISDQTEGASEDEGTDKIQARANVRVRSTVAMCLPLSMVRKGGSPTAVLPLKSSGRGGELAADGTWNLAPTMTFDYCAGERWYKE